MREDDWQEFCEVRRYRTVDDEMLQEKIEDDNEVEVNEKKVTIK